MVSCPWDYVIRWISQALSALSPRGSFLPLICHAVVHVVQLSILILLVSSQVGRCLGSYLLNLLHRDMLLGAVAGASHISLIHIGIPV